MSTQNYNLPSDIPFTTAESDYQKLRGTAASFADKEALIDYSSTDFVTLRDSLFAYMQAVYPQDYQIFSESDFGVMFAELVSYMGAVVSFKTDALANENFLATARNRSNVQKLLTLIGVRMKGPTSAGGRVTLSLDASATSNPVILAADRVITLTSPMDGGQVSYTLYPVDNGKLQSLAADSTDIELLLSQSPDNRVWNNLALVEGSLVSETGTFDTTQIFKSIALGQGPVIENSVQVFIAGQGNTSGTYTQVENLYSASGPSDKIFEIVYDDLYNGTVRFGDGSVGSSPPNSSSYRVIYRVGGGERGNFYGQVYFPLTTAGGAAGTLSNDSVISGGMPAETVEDAKRNGPLTFKQQDRLVTLGDYESFVSRYSSPLGGTGIATAATMAAYCTANVINIFVLQKASSNQLQKATIDYKTKLLSAMNKKKMLTDELVIVDGLIRTLDLIVTLYVDASLQTTEDTIKQIASKKITDFFSYSNFEFGTTFTPQVLNRLLFNISEVRFSSIDNVTESIEVEFNEVIQLNNLSINIAYI